MLLDGSLTDEQGRGDRSVVVSARHLGEHLQLPRAQSPDAGVPAAHPRLDQVLDDLGVDNRATLGHGRHRGDELVNIGDPLLQEVPATGGPALEQRTDVSRIDVLAEQDDTRRRMVGPAVPRDLDPFVSPAGRHPDVSQDDVRVESVDLVADARQVPTASDHVDVGHRGQ